MQHFTELQFGNTQVGIEKGELIRFTIDGVEYMHQKGNPGWRKSDDEMFPVIGPTEKNNFRVHTKKGDGILDQHGLLRELEYTLIHETEASANFLKSYTAGETVKNSKYSEKSKEPNLNWPYDFEFEKRFTLRETSLSIEFVFRCEKGMPFMLGYHPAFLLSGTGKETIFDGRNHYNLAHVYEAGSNAYPILNTSEVILNNQGKHNVKITTEGFNHFMLWTEVDHMLCIEPITQYTSYTNQKFSEENMRIAESENRFLVNLTITDE